MSEFWHAAAGWAAHAAVAGGTVLGAGWVWLRRVEQPARRYRLAAWTVRGAVLAAVLCLFPAWLTVPAPAWPGVVPGQAPDEPVAGPRPTAVLQEADAPAAAGPRAGGVVEEGMPDPSAFTVFAPAGEAVDRPPDPPGGGPSRDDEVSPPDPLPAR